MNKEQLANYITHKIGVTPVVFSRGSTEPKELLTLICQAIGLDFNENSTKPELGKLIVESSGSIWQDSFESSGSTITRDGMVAIKKAVDFFIKD